MAAPHDAMVAQSDSFISPLCVITSLPEGERVVEVRFNSSAPITLRTITSSGLLDAWGEQNMTDKLNEIDGRLRNVEIDVSAIKERLNHMPTKHEMWIAIAAPVLTVASAIGLGAWWIVQQYLAPILEKTGGG